MTIQKKNVFLHVGVAKTGSSAIQNTLESLKNDGVLAENNFDFLHRSIWDSIFDFLHTKDEVRFIENISNELKNCSHDNIILSSEGFSADRIYQYDFISDIFVKPLSIALRGYNVKSIIYIRRQDTLFESWVAQAIKCGLTRNVLQDIKTNFYYKKFLDSHVQCFGKKNTFIRIYDRELLHQNDVVKDFFKIIGLNELLPIKLDSLDSNNSLSPEAFRTICPLTSKYILTQDECKERLLKLENAYSKGELERNSYTFLSSHLDLGVDMRENTYRWRYIPLLLLNDSSIRGSVGYLSKDERKAIWEQYAEDNAAVAREYFGREDGILFSTKMPKRIEKITDPSTSDIVCTFMPILGNLDERVEHLTHARDHHSTTQDQHSTTLDKHGAKLDNHSTTLDQHSTTLDNHSAKLDNHSTTLDNYSARLDNYSIMFDQLTSQLNHLNSIILQQEEMIASLRAEQQAMLISSQRRVLYIKRPWKYLPVIIRKICHRLAIQAKFPKCYALLQRIFQKFNFWK